MDILNSEGITCMAYIDDIVRVADTLEQANKDFERAISLMSKLGLEEATDNRNAPSTVITWLGISFDSVNRVMQVPPQKLKTART